MARHETSCTSRPHTGPELLKAPHRIEVALLEDDSCLEDLENDLSRPDWQHRASTRGARGASASVWQSADMQCIAAHNKRHGQGLMVKKAGLLACGISMRAHAHVEAGWLTCCAPRAAENCLWPVRLAERPLLRPQPTPRHAPRDPCGLHKAMGC